MNQENIARLRMNLKDIEKRLDEREKRLKRLLGRTRC